MVITGYTAMTAAEFCSLQTLPTHPAWMACHFSCYATGLTNFPRDLPEGSMVIINDRTPVQGHDPELILEQMTALWQTLKPDCFLLDFQRPGNEETAQIVRLLTQKLPCPVGVTEHYAQGLDCPVFLAPPPIDCPLEEHLDIWSGREIWLEIAEDAQTATITTDGCRFSSSSVAPLQEPFFYDSNVHCSYHIELQDNAAVFHLLRSKEALHNMLNAAGEYGITRAVGLYQQLGCDFFTQ